MNLRTFYRASAIVIAAQVALAVWGVWAVGPATRVPIHWGFDGQPNGYGSASVSFAFVPLLTAGIVALFSVVPRIEPRRHNLERSASAYRTTAIAVIVFLGLTQVVVVLASLGDTLPMVAIVGLGIGLLFIVMGNVLTTVRSNFLFGVRTPWTLTSDLSWDRTHRLVGRLFVLAGLTLVLLTLAGNVELIVGVMVAWIVVIVVAAFVYSYRVWATDPNRRSGEQPS